MISGINIEKRDIVLPTLIIKHPISGGDLQEYYLHWRECEDNKRFIYNNFLSKKSKLSIKNW